MAAPNRTRSSSHSSFSTFWELELQAGAYRSPVPSSAALNFHGRALVEESNRNTLNNILARARQNTPFLPPNSRLQLEQHFLQLRDHQNTPCSRDSFVQDWRGDYETGDHRNTDCDRFVTQARNRVDPLLPPTRGRNARNADFEVDDSDNGDSDDEIDDETDDDNDRVSPEVDDSEEDESEEDGD